jgi:SOS response associated peptidase (SRAP)
VRAHTICRASRCLIPASHFFEFTGTKSPKSKWKFTKAGGDWFCFAGLWRPMPDGAEAFTLLTTEPGPDVAPIHNRQMVVLDRPDWLAMRVGLSGMILSGAVLGCLHRSGGRCALRTPWPGGAPSSGYI